MRVRCLESTEYNDTGDVIIVQENDETLLDIENGFVEQFVYKMSDDDILNQCDEYYRKEDYEELHRFILGIYEADSVNNILFQDGRKIEWMFQPSTPEHWFVRNSLHIDYYSKRYPLNTIEGLKKEFYKRAYRAPDAGMFLEREREQLNSWIKAHRSNMGCDLLKDDPYYVSDSWYDIAISGSIPISEELREFLSSNLPGGIIEFLRGKSLAEYEGFLNTFSKTHIKSQDNNSNALKKVSEETQLKVRGINVKALVGDLVERKYINKGDRTRLTEWFYGSTPEKPINILTKMNYFITVIADLCDSKPSCIQNSKKFCYSHIHETLLFDGQKASISYITNVMKPYGANRLSNRNKLIPDIENFRTSR